MIVSAITTPNATDLRIDNDWSMINPKKLIGRLLCRIGLHNWEITKYCNFKDRQCRILKSEGFDRDCLRCDKRQRLLRPEKYHPSKYVWTDIPF